MLGAPARTSLVGQTSGWGMQRGWRRHMALVVGVAISVLLHSAVILSLTQRTGRSSLHGESRALTVFFVDAPTRRAVSQSTAATATATATATARSGASGSPAVARHAGRIAATQVNKHVTDPSSSPERGMADAETDLTSTLLDWRESETSFVRSDDEPQKSGTAEEAVTRQSHAAGDHMPTAVGGIPNPVAQAFDAVIGQGPQSVGAVSSYLRPGGSRIERIQTASGLYCVRIPGQATSTDPFDKRERPLNAEKC
jgi:hypothetical protein